MSKKLLTEAEFRQFTKLADISSDLAEKRVQAIYTEDEPAEEDDPANTIDELDVGALEDEDLAPVGEPEDLGGEEELGLDDVEPEAEMAAEPVSLTDEQADAIVDLAGQIQATRGTEGAPEEEVDLDAELDPHGAEEEVPPPVDDEELAPGGRMGGTGGLYENEDEIIEAVVKRVSQRLTKEQKIDDIASQLAEKILNRLD